MLMYLMYTKADSAHAIAVSYLSSSIIVLEGGHVSNGDPSEQVELHMYAVKV